MIDKVIQGGIKYDQQGYWNMIKDSILIYKLIARNKVSSATGGDYYKKIMGQISKHILQKHDYSEKRNYPVRFTFIQNGPKKQRQKRTNLERELNRGAIGPFS